MAARKLTVERAYSHNSNLLVKVFLLQFRHASQRSACDFQAAFLRVYGARGALERAI